LGCGSGAEDQASYAGVGVAEGDGTANSPACAGYEDYFGGLREVGFGGINGGVDVVVDCLGEGKSDVRREVSHGLFCLCFLSSRFLSFVWD
jgi:hypothetical protein